MRELNDAWLRTLKPPEAGRLEVRDSRVRGLVLRMTPTGAATWSIRTRTRNGKQTRPALGTWPAMGIADARRKALSALAAIQAGADPVADKREARVERKAQQSAPTVSARLADWRAKKDANWSPRYAAEVTRLCRVEIEPKLGKRPLGETTRSDWTALISAKQRRTPGVAAMLYRTCASFLNHAEGHGWLPFPLLPRKGAAIVAPPVAARERVLTDTELSAVWLAADREPPRLRAFIRILILTGARELEVADMAAGEIDLRTARWTIPAARAKNSHSLTLPLGTLALAELRAVWPQHGPDPIHKLLGRGVGGFRGFSRLKARIDVATTIIDWRWHDLRRTVRTGLARLGVRPDHAEATLNHVSGRSALERTYDRHDFAPEVIAASEQWQAHVASLIGVRIAAGTDRGNSGGQHLIRRIGGFRYPRQDAANSCQGRDPPISTGTAAAEKGKPNVLRADGRAQPTMGKSQEEEKSSSRHAAAGSRSASSKNELREMSAKISRAEWELMEAVLPPARQQLLHRVRALIAATTRPEFDDVALLRQVEMSRRQQPGLTEAGARGQVVASLPVDDSSQSGVVRINVGNRTLSKASLERTLRRKYKKHGEEIARWADGTEAGRALAQERVAPLLDPSARAVRFLSPSGRTPPGKGPPSVDRPVDPNEGLPLNHTTNAFVREAMSGIVPGLTVDCSCSRVDRRVKLGDNDIRLKPPIISPRAGLSLASGCESKSAPVGIIRRSRS